MKERTRVWVTVFAVVIVTLLLSACFRVSGTIEFSPVPSELPTAAQFTDALGISYSVEEEGALVIDTLQSSASTQNTLTISGSVINNGETADFAYVNLTVYDGDHHSLGGYSSRVENLPLDQGESSPFYTLETDIPIAKVIEYLIEVPAGR